LRALGLRQPVLAILAAPTPKAAQPDKRGAEQHGHRRKWHCRRSKDRYCRLPMSATKTFPRLLGAVRSAILTLARKMMSVLNVELNLFLQVVHAMPKLKFPVPSH
jgi:hypothetical protein